MLKKIKRNIFLIYYTIRLICKICKAKFILAFILSIINGILPVSSLLVMQQLLNEIQNKTQSYQYVVYLLILYFGLIISESLLQNLASYNLNNLNNHLVYGINYILMKKCGDLSLEMLERTETYRMNIRWICTTLKLGACIKRNISNLKSKKHIHIIVNFCEN